MSFDCVTDTVNWAVYCCGLKQIAAEIVSSLNFIQLSYRIWNSYSFSVNVLATKFSSRVRYWVSWFKDRGYSLSLFLLMLFWCLYFLFSFCWPQNIPGTSGPMVCYFYLPRLQIYHINATGKALVVWLSKKPVICARLHFSKCLRFKYLALEQCSIVGWLLF